MIKIYPLGIIGKLSETYGRKHSQNLYTLEMSPISWDVICYFE